MKNAICSSRTTLGNGTEIAYGQDLDAPTLKPLYRVWLNEQALSQSGEMFRMKMFYNWLVSGSKSSSTDVCAPTWLQLAISHDPKAIKVIRFVENLCCNVLYASHEANAIEIIEAHIQPVLRDTL